MSQPIIINLKKRLIKDILVRSVMSIIVAFGILSIYYYPKDFLYISDNVNFDWKNNIYSSPNYTINIDSRMFKDFEISQYSSKFLGVDSVSGELLYADDIDYDIANSRDSIKIYPELSSLDFEIRFNKNNSIKSFPLSFSQNNFLLDKVNLYRKNQLYSSDNSVSSLELYSTFILPLIFTFKIKSLIILSLTLFLFIYVIIFVRKKVKVNMT